jgi:hypothetical protein
MIPLCEADNCGKTAAPRHRTSSRLARPAVTESGAAGAGRVRGTLETQRFFINWRTARHQAIVLAVAVAWHAETLHGQIGPGTELGIFPKGVAGERPTLPPDGTRLPVHFPNGATFTVDLKSKCPRTRRPFKHPMARSGE